jgi:hypothetical protein
MALKSPTKMNGKVTVILSLSDLLEILVLVAAGKYYAK